MSQLNPKSPENQNNQTSVEEIKRSIKITISPESKNDIVKKELEAYFRGEEAQPVDKPSALEIQRTQEQKKALEQIKNDKLNEFTIFESGVSLGIVVGTTTKDEVVNIMKSYSVINYSTDPNPVHFYSDLSLYVIFDINGTVQELVFSEGYKGMTSKGLRPGDSIQEAIIIYGPPKMKSPKGAIWEKFAVFCDYYIINSIKIHN